MKLQVLVPHYQERADEIEPLLDSIAIQQAVNMRDVGVVIAYKGYVMNLLPVGLLIQCMKNSNGGGDSSSSGSSRIASV